MKHLMWTLVLSASLAAPLPALAQNAVPRGGGSSGGGGGSSSGGGGSSSGGGSTASSGGSSSSSDGGGGSSWAPPRHPGASSGRSRGGSESGSTASSRRSPGGSSAASGSGSGSGSDRVVGGRTRDGRPITGYAVPRGTVVPGGRPGGDYIYYPRGRDWYYSPWYYSRYSPYYYTGFGASLWGLGYIWDPFWFGPGYGGYGGYGIGDPWGYGAGYGGGGGYADAGEEDEQDEVEGQGNLRIKVKPRDAKVLVDGTFAGTVDDFDGNFQKLRLDEGAHKVELQADGYEPLRFDVLIVDGQTVTYKGQLRPR
jgi:hypothetical protein